jgi:hypothetical protein
LADKAPLFVRNGMTLPHLELMQRAGIGVVSALVGSDSILRRWPLMSSVDGRAAPGFVLALMRAGADSPAVQVDGGEIQVGSRRGRLTPTVKFGDIIRRPQRLAHCAGLSCCVGRFRRGGPGTAGGFVKGHKHSDSLLSKQPNSAVWTALVSHTDLQMPFSGPPQHAATSQYFSLFQDLIMLSSPAILNPEKRVLHHGGGTHVVDYQAGRGG